MTDNRTTELREKLTEHGVKHEDSELTDFNDGTTTYYTEWGGNDDGDGANVYVEYVDGTVLRMFDATPEQAIAATLGGYEPPYDELLRCLKNDWNINASWDGLRKFWCIELTDEGVRIRDAAHGTLTAEQVSKAVYEHSIHADCADADWQAIADELNAALGSGTCKLLVDGDLLHCSNCGGAAEKQSWAYWSYCPNCGARVIGTESGE